MNKGLTLHELEVEDGQLRYFQLAIIAAMLGGAVGHSVFWVVAGFCGAYLIAMCWEFWKRDAQ